MNSITIVGAGTMGNGIAHHFALFDFNILLIDSNRDQLDRALSTISKNLDRQVNKEIITKAQSENALNNIRASTNLEESHASELIIEATTEKKEIKSAVLQKLNKIAKEDTIIATNTSSISITDLGANLNNPEKFIGMHFMNPVPVMKLVEIINGYSTSPATTETIIKLTEQIKKTPVVVNDYPGFISNRILMPMINEAIYALHEGVSGVEQIDTIMRLGMAHPMGPLQLADYIGLDVCLSILEVLYSGMGNPKYAPCPLLKNMVAAGKSGIKSGEGFYLYQNGKPTKVSNRFFK